MTPEYIDAMAHLAKVSRRLCERCPVPGECCQPGYCEATIAYAKKKGVTLHRTLHPNLSLLQYGGCTAPPHLRPVCTMWVCEGQRSDPEYIKAWKKAMDLTDPKETEIYFSCILPGVVTAWAKGKKRNG